MHNSYSGDSKDNNVTNNLNKDWTPTFGTIYTWFAMDKNGRIAVMVNNCWGDLPQSVLNIPDAELLLDDLNEYMWEESKTYTNYPQDKAGELVVDLYSYWRNNDRCCKKFSISTVGRIEKWHGYIIDLYCFFGNKIVSRDKITKKLTAELKQIKNYSDANLSVNKGYFLYFAVDGYNEGDDYPVGYKGPTKIGDYYRYLLPTIYASIEDFPKELWHGIAVSDTLDFTKDRVLDNDKINTYFTRNYHN